MDQKQLDELKARLSAEIAAMTPEELEAKLRRAGMKDDEPAPDPLSALQQALDDGQEIKMHRFWNPRTQQNEYLVRIYADCYLETEHVDLVTAAKSVAFKFSQWLDAHNRDDDGDDDDYSPNEPGHDDDGCPTT